MNTGRLFWGMVFVTAGFLLLCDRLGFFAVTWVSVWRLWPLVLVFWGIALVLGATRARWVAVAFAGITVAVIVAGLVNLFWWDGTFWKVRSVMRQELVEPLGEAPAHARLRFDSGAGTFAVVDTSAELLEADARTSLGSYRLEKTSKGDLVELSLTMEGDTPAHFGQIKNSVDLRLNTRPLWDLEFDVGATELSMDLSPYRIGTVLVDCGASSVRLTLGERADSTRVTIDAGASSVRLRVPEASGCRVELDAGLSSKRLPEFQRVSDGVYETENYLSSTRRILVILDAGVSSIRVDRYRSERPARQW